MSFLRRFTDAFLGRRPGGARGDLHDSEIDALRDRHPLVSGGGDADAGDSKSTMVDPYGIDRAGVDRGREAGYGGDTDAGDRKTEQVDPYGSDSLGRDPRG